MIEGHGYQYLRVFPVNLLKLQQKLSDGENYEYPDAGNCNPFER
jgi:hypothetical protein